MVEPAAYPENYLMSSAILDEGNQNLLAAARERLAKVPSILKRLRQAVLAAAYSGQLGVTR